jgi:hypothetical protein
MSLLHRYLYVINEGFGEHNVGYFIEYTGLFFRNVVCTKYDIYLFRGWFNSSYG